MAKNPMMPLWVSDLLSDPNVVIMPNEEFGAYMRLLCHCWTMGSLPNDDLTLSKLSFSGRKWKRLKGKLMSLFVLTEDGVYIHKRIEREKTRLVKFKQSQSIKGKKGAEARWPRPCPSHSTGHQEENSRGHSPGHKAKNGPGYSYSTLKREEASYKASSLSPPSLVSPPQNAAAASADSELAQGALRHPVGSEPDDDIHERAEAWSTPEELAPEEPENKSPELPSPLPQDATTEQIRNQKARFTQCLQKEVVSQEQYNTEMRKLDRKLKERKRRDDLDSILEETETNAPGSPTPPP